MQFSVPATHDPALSLAYSNVVADHEKLDLVGFFGVLRGVLLRCETKVEDIASVVPVPSQDYFLGQ